MILHAATIFLSAFLLFLVQPIIAKQILPWFGGAAAVWATCLVFFQTVLLFGYAYADWTSRYLAPKRQAWLHIALLGLSLLLLPIIPDAAWKPGGEGDRGPTIAILGLLTATIGLQYFLVSTTSPLVQAWFWRRFRHAVPYRLFALSNFASLLALLSYPVLVEPFLTLHMQSISWSIGYSVFAFLCAATALVSVRHGGARPMLDPAAAPAAESGPADGGRMPTAGERVLWIALSATGSCLLLAVTNHLTQNIAAVPFLWVVPLSLYLITFILCFDHPRWYQRPVFLTLVAMLLPVMAVYSDSLDLWVAAPLYAAGLFICCMFCHGELYLLKPGPRYLTTFYLMISIGGALGALLIGIGAPNLLNGYYELKIVLVVCAALLVWRGLSIRKWVAGGAAAVAAATAAIAVYNVNYHLADTRVMLRNFYGVVRTQDFPEPVPFRAMYHGGIQHGGQLLDPEYRRLPITYFGPTSGYGRVFASLPEEPRRRVGVVGLGAGVIAAYGRPGDVFRFYEIDPQVAAVAVREFTYLTDSLAQTEIVLGDGRLSLEREPDQHYDLLALDAFSGDSIPMHLLTREAMATYVRHLKPDGVIVFQATNRFVDIAPVVARLAEEFGYKAVMVSDWPEQSYTRPVDYWLSNTDQIIFTRNEALLNAERVRSAAEPLATRPGMRTWTDDFYNLLQILKR
jgi:SAM-dependent methyltransferase